MTMNALNAANAYRNQLKMMQNAQPSPEEQTNGPAFSQLVENALSDAVDTQMKSENLQMQSLSGKVELSELVTAVANAELSLNTVVAVRDRIINAYNDIAKMPI